MAFNNGSYTGAIFFAGFMYIGAAAFLWLVRAWKIGEVEEKAAIARKSTNNVSPIESGEHDATAPPEDFKKSSFVKRLLMWTRV